MKISRSQTSTVFPYPGEFTLDGICRDKRPSSNRIRRFAKRVHPLRDQEDKRYQEMP